MEQRNVILAFALSMIVLLGWGMLVPEPVPVDKKQSQTEQATNNIADNQIPEVMPAPTPENEQTVAPAQINTLSSKTETFGNDVLQLQVNEQGRLVGATVPKYRQSLEPDSKPVTVLEISDRHAMYLRTDVSGRNEVPEFQVVSKSRQNGAEQISLQGKLSDGKIWQRFIRLQPDSYVVEIEDRIINGAGLKVFRQVIERYPNKEDSTFQEYVGPIGLMGDKLRQESYESLDQEKFTPLTATGGWTGIMSRYFIAAIIGDQASEFKYYYHGDGRTYRAGMLDDGVVDGNDAVFKAQLYIGPKSIPAMKELGVGLERSIDFGWFAFIAKPLHDLLLWFHKYISNLGGCIILLVVVIKLVFYWPTQKSYVSMAGMRKLQPEMARLKEQYGDDKQVMGQKTMALYKKNKINPLGGCLPILIQIPVFFALYKVLLMSIEMRHAPLGGWIHDLSAQDPFFVLPVLMGASMLIQQRLNPQPPDPIQAKVMQFLPLLFTVMFLFFPAGLVLYWLVNNVLSIVQQYFVMKAQNAIDV